MYNTFFSPIIFVSSIENKIIGIGILLIMFLDIIEKKNYLAFAIFNYYTLQTKYIDFVL